MRTLGIVMALAVAVLAFGPVGGERPDQPPMSFFVTSAGPR